MECLYNNKKISEKMLSIKVMNSTWNVCINNHNEKITPVLDVHSLALKNKTPCSGNSRLSISTVTIHY